MVLQQYGVEALKLFAHIVIASCICAGVRNFMSRNRRYCSSHVFHEKFICWVYGTNSGIAYRRCGRGGRRRIQKMNTHENCSVRSHHDVATLLDRLLLPTRCYSTPLPAASTTFCAPSSPPNAPNVSTGRLLHAATCAVAASMQSSSSSATTVGPLDARTRRNTFLRARRASTNG